MAELYIGLMSGTSGDGIDAVLVDFSQAAPKLLATYYSSYTPELREKIFSLCESGADEVRRLGELDIILAKEFAKAANDLLTQQAISADQIKAIGSHGQTIRHSPLHPHRFTMQIGDPNTITAETGITTVADFRRKDIALGGQGAPLVPAFHHAIFASQQKNRAIVNIGGIANITLLPQNQNATVIGFDTGPGNTLMDSWIETHHQQHYDTQGNWAQQGNLHINLLNQLLRDQYFDLQPPKSTGREYFNLIWLQKHLNQASQDISPVDVQRTLAELTTLNIVNAIKKHFQQGEILVCGGGAHNHFLMSRLQELAKPQFTLDSTERLGIHPDWVEAMAFAWLAKQTLNYAPGNLPSVTGARKASVLGGIYYP